MLRVQLCMVRGRDICLFLDRVMSVLYMDACLIFYEYCTIMYEFKDRILKGGGGRGNIM